MEIGDVGFIAGLLTIAVGMALQKPISSVFAWLIIVTRRPFSIGDRVVISNIRGDVVDISLTHIYLEEVGGTIDGEEKSTVVNEEEFIICRACEVTCPDEAIEIIEE